VLRTNCHNYRDDTVSTENLTTLFAVVPKSGKGEWLGSYEQISDFVVRRNHLAEQPVLWDAASASVLHSRLSHAGRSRSESQRTCAPGRFCENSMACLGRALLQTTVHAIPTLNFFDRPDKSTS